MSKDITEFQGEYRWLSNFWPAEVLLDGHIYRTVENAYQAAKSTSPVLRAPYRHCLPGEAKRLARTVKLAPDWHIRKKAVMQALIAQKFTATNELGARLLATGSVQIVEGNRWGDTFWGVCNGVGENNLGELLMARRHELQVLVK